MVTFIIVRHGNSVANKGNFFAGQADVPLNDTGYKQAQEVSKYILENFKVDKVYSSDLSRTYETVKPVADALGMVVNKRKDLREVDVGLWANKSYDEVEKEFPESFKRYMTNAGCSKFDGGESYKESAYRGKKAMDIIASENEGKTVVVGTHGGIIKGLRALWGNIPFDKLKDIPHVNNASVTVAEYYNGKVNLKAVGLNEHLTEKTI